MVAGPAQQLFSVVPEAEQGLGPPAGEDPLLVPLDLPTVIYGQDLLQIQLGVERFKMTITRLRQPTPTLDQNSALCIQAKRGIAEV